MKKAKLQKQIVLIEKKNISLFNIQQHTFENTKSQSSCKFNCPVKEECFDPFSSCYYMTLSISFGLSVPDEN